MTYDNLGQGIASNPQVCDMSTQWWASQVLEAPLFRAMPSRLYGGGRDMKRLSPNSRGLQRPQYPSPRSRKHKWHTLIPCTPHHPITQCKRMYSKKKFIYKLRGNPSLPS